MSKIKLLIVEDNLVYSRLMKAQISGIFQDSVEIFLVNSIAEARSAFLVNSFDIVILDLILPDSTGFESVKMIQQFDSTIPIIVVTASDDEKLRLSSIISGAEVFINKNVDPNPNWSHIILGAIDNNRRDKNRYSLIENRLQSLTTVTESLLLQVKQANIAIFGNGSKDSKDGSLINQLVEIKNELAATNRVTSTITKIFWITLPILITLFAGIWILFVFWI